MSLYLREVFDLNIKKFLIVISSAAVMTFSMAATTVFAADDDTLPEGAQTNAFADADSIKGAKTWDNSLNAAAGYAFVGAAALGTGVAASKIRKKDASADTDSDNK